MLLIFGHSNGDWSLVGHTSLRSQRPKAYTAYEGACWRVNGPVPPAPLWEETLNVSWWDLWGVVGYEQERGLLLSFQ